VEEYKPLYSGAFSLVLKRAAEQLQGSPFAVTVQAGATSAAESYSYGAGMCTTTVGRCRLKR